MFKEQIQQEHMLLEALRLSKATCDSTDLCKWSHYHVFSMPAKKEPSNEKVTKGENQAIPKTPPS